MFITLEQRGAAAARPIAMEDTQIRAFMSAKECMIMMAMKGEERRNLQLGVQKSSISCLHLSTLSSRTVGGSISDSQKDPLDFVEYELNKSNRNEFIHSCTKCRFPNQQRPQVLQLQPKHISVTLLKYWSYRHNLPPVNCQNRISQRSISRDRRLETYCRIHVAIWTVRVANPKREQLHEALPRAVEIGFPTKIVVICQRAVGEERS